MRPQPHNFPDAESKRLTEDRERAAHWRRWGPYLSERQWGTVREDYSPYGTAWHYFPHDHARSRAYRWGEDGLLGISDNHQRLCFSLALWNGRDSILKERPFGLTTHEGNHGEDVKEYYYYLDSTPTHAYMKGLYKYPHAAFPYEDLVRRNAEIGRAEPEYELIDTGIFSENRYFDVDVEYAKAAPEDLLIRITARNRGAEPQLLHLLPTVWFRNTWSWNGGAPKPRLQPAGKKGTAVDCEHATLGPMRLSAAVATEILFTENETNFRKLFGTENRAPFVKDGIHEYLVQGDREAVNFSGPGTKAAFHYRKTVEPGGCWTVKLRLSRPEAAEIGWEEAFEALFSARLREADEFYGALAPESLSPDHRNIQRQAFAGLLWTKQFYHYVVKDWIDGDPASPPPPAGRKDARNHEWGHLYNEDILTLPDKWEYPWFASWDLAFHCLPLALVDPEFAKKQLLLLTREWYMHPNGQLPAYEWDFGDVNPPVHAWAALRVYKIEKKMTGRADRLFLERVFQKLLLNFTWWVNRKDANGNNIFQGGFLGLDNIGLFDRSKPLPAAGYVEQSDGTSWMAMYCLNLLAIALELARENSAYEDIASKFFEHFLQISEAMNRIGGGLWDETDGFFYDRLNLNSGHGIPLKVRSMVGLIPLLAVETIDVELFFRLPGFARRFNWFLKNRPDLARDVTCNGRLGICERRLLSAVAPERLRRILERMLAESEFLSPYGIRSVSRAHEAEPCFLRLDGSEYRLDYEPGESRTHLFGGNSNWRGPVWMPVNFLLLEGLQKFHHYLGDDFKVECPAGSGRRLTLWQVAGEISNRLIRIFARDGSGRRPFNGEADLFQRDPHWKDLILFHEFFHGDHGKGLGASHQTGWTALVAKLIQQHGEYAAK